MRDVSKGHQGADTGLTDVTSQTDRGGVEQSIRLKASGWIPECVGRHGDKCSRKSWLVAFPLISDPEPRVHVIDKRSVACYKYDSDVPRWVDVSSGRHLVVARGKTGKVNTARPLGSGVTETARRSGNAFRLVSERRFCFAGRRRECALVSSAQARWVRR